MVVGDLMTAGRWDDRVLGETFWPIDCECIRSIPLGRTGHADALLWHFDPRGVFTVKSAYKLAKERKIVDSSSESELVQKWWKALWNCHVSGKSKVFMWRCFNGILPWLTNLAKRGVKCLLSCPVCGDDRETVGHAICGCPKAKMVWGQSALAPVLNKLNHVLFDGVYLRAFSLLSKMDLEVFCLYLGAFPLCDTVERRQTPCAPRTLVRWSKPVDGLKLNVDAACRPGMEVVLVSGGTQRERWWPVAFVESDAANVVSAANERRTLGDLRYCSVFYHRFLVEFVNISQDQPIWLLTSYPFMV
ncbi:hypothetical protein TIFTF001_004803 [Ficus carica]|uniref:Reverse transcriptase zinc-binding domain-containing protein n=1 Tax=Ficus carica TaxID=3494 RepID=A0AA88CTS2_FICCA|nr:hypothetical protein TIFTF001_004803 [Ficus carica]